MQAEGPIEPGGVGVGEQLGEVEAIAAQRVERAVGAQAVARARADAVDRGAVDAGGVGAEPHARRLAIGALVIEAEIDGAGARGIDRDVDAARGRRDAERRGRVVRSAHGASFASAR
jgi:hypothetical protein